MIKNAGELSAQGNFFIRPCYHRNSNTTKDLALTLVGQLGLHVLVVLSVTQFLLKTLLITSAISLNFPVQQNWRAMHACVHRHLEKFGLQGKAF